MNTRIVSDLVIFFLTLAVLAGTATPAAAIDTYWQHDPATPGDWFDPANWDNGAPITHYYDAYIDNGGTAQITATNRVHYLYLGCTPGHSGTVAQSGGTNTVTEDMFLGREPGSSGTYNLSGDSVLYVEGECIGEYGTGEFNQSGGIIEH